VVRRTQRHNDQRAQGATHLRSELAGSREHRLDIGGRGLLARNLGQIHSVVDWEHRLVLRPEHPEVEAGGALVVLRSKPLRHESTVPSAGAGHEGTSQGTRAPWPEYCSCLSARQVVEVLPRRHDLDGARHLHQARVLLDGLADTHLEQRICLPSAHHKAGAALRH